MRGLEICVDSKLGAEVALKGGARRVELCSALEIGGVTPSIGVIGGVRSIEGLELNVLIRPRGGDFLYNEQEVESMVRDIEAAKALGVDGVVIGALTKEGDVDMDVCGRLVEAASSLQVTFHRAFDMCRDKEYAIEQIVSLGCNRILTSGGRASAAEGVEELKRYVELAQGRLSIMAGCGVNSQNAAQIIELSGVTELHASARRVVRSEMSYRHEGVFMGGNSEDEYLLRRTSLEEVRLIAEAISKVE